MKTCVSAFAKLNLSLQVVGVRSDGFHEIRSVVQTIDLADRIVLETDRAIRVVCDRPVDGVNIAERAARVLLDRKSAQEGVRIGIEKAIPMGAGLGGGSSDAAAVLATLDRWTRPRLPQNEMLELAETLGSDVPLFLMGGCMQVGGRGQPERSLPIRLESYVLLVPDLHCSTRDIYDAWTPERKQRGSVALGENDLYPAALRVYPELEIYHDAVRRLGGDYAGMTGSGSAFYAAFSDPHRAEIARENLRRAWPDCRVYYCRSTHTGWAEERVA